MTHRLLPLVRRRAFSQQRFSRASVSASDARDRHAKQPPSPPTQPRAPSPRAQHALDGRSYLLPTMTLQRAPGSDAIVSTTAPSEGPLLQPRSSSTPIVLDLQLVSSDGSPHARPIKKHELRAEIQRLHSLGFVPVGITNASEDVKQLATKMHLPYLISTRLQATTAPPQPPATATPTTTVSHPEEPPTTAAARAESESDASHHDHEADPDAEADPEADATPEDALAKAELPPMVVYAGVRSGQQVFAQHRSLIVLGHVSSGAEVLADGDVFVLGALKGRALAGLGGNTHARIVCQSFDAELVSIAHHFTTCDDLAAQREHSELRTGKPTTVTLQLDGQLFFHSAS